MLTAHGDTVQVVVVERLSVPVRVIAIFVALATLARLNGTYMVVIPLGCNPPNREASQAGAIGIPKN